MKTIKYKSLQDFVDNFDFNLYSKNTLLISDIDGVFFNSIYDPQAIIGKIRKNDLKAFEKTLRRISACWIITNRWKIFRNFPFIKQITNSIKKYSTTPVPIYSNCSEFLADRLQKFTIILNAKKPSIPSQKVVEKGLSSFENVIYIGAHDRPFKFADWEVVKSLEKRINLDKLTFVEIQ